MSDISFTIKNVDNNNNNDFTDTPKVGAKKEKDILEEMKFIDFEPIYKINENKQEIKDIIDLLRKESKKSERDKNSKVVKIHPTKEDFIPSSFSTNISCIIF